MGIASIWCPSPWMRGTPQTQKNISQTSHIDIICTFEAYMLRLLLWHIQNKMVKNTAEKQCSFSRFSLQTAFEDDKDIGADSFSPCWVFYSEIFSTELLNDFCSMQVGEEVERALQNFTPKVGSRWVIGHWSLLSSQYLHALYLLTLESHESSDHCANFQFVMSLVLAQFSHAAWPKNCGNSSHTRCVHSCCFIQVSKIFVVIHLTQVVCTSEGEM